MQILATICKSETYSYIQFRFDATKQRLDGVVTLQEHPHMMPEQTAMQQPAMATK